MLDGVIAWIEAEADSARDTLDLDPELWQRLSGASWQAPAPRDRGLSRDAVAPAPRQDDVAAPEERLGRIAQEITACRKCALHRTRNRPVPGQGNCHPDILFIGEGPGAEEDAQGLAFVGEAGRLLTRMITAMGYRREAVFIANVVKCRPPDNRIPHPNEMEACLPFLRRQIAILRPKVIVTLGATALRGLLGTSVGITRLRGQWQSFEGIDVMPTYHPAYLLRYPHYKADAWKDLQKVLERLGRPVLKKPVAPSDAPR